MIINFKEWLLALEAKTEEEWQKALWNYFQDILKHPSFEDVKTLLKMIKENMPNLSSNMLSDMLPSLEKIMVRFTLKQQEELQIAISDVSDDDLYHNIRMIQRGWTRTMTGPYAFASDQEFEHYINTLMEQNPNLELIVKIINANKEHFVNLGESFQRYFEKWFKQEVKRQGKQPTLSSELKKLLKGGEQEASDL